jgi:uncharacterized protein YoxC
MSIEWFRDLIIVIYGFFGIIVLIFLVVLAILIYQKTRTVLNAIQSTTDDIKKVVSTIKEEFVDPLVQLMAIIQGVKQGINVISQLFRKNKGGNDE